MFNNLSTQFYRPGAVTDAYVAMHKIKK